MAWQKSLRIVVALVGIAVALAVYFTMRERQPAGPPQPVQRVDPRASIEIAESVLKNFAGTFKDFEVTQKLMGQYPDGSTKLVEPSIVIRRSETRTFRIAANEAKVTDNQNHFELTGNPIRLEDNEGFWLETATAAISRPDSIVRIPGPERAG